MPSAVRGPPVGSLAPEKFSSLRGSSHLGLRRWPPPASEQRTIMDSKAESATSVDDPDMRQPPAADGTDPSPTQTGTLPRESIDDALLDEFWRRRSAIGHC
jgi:hypothetical protein